MKLYLVRHGQTDWNLDGKIQGSYDSELNDTGIIQANELAKIILESNFKISKICVYNVILLIHLLMKWQNLKWAIPQLRKLTVKC